MSYRPWLTERALRQMNGLPGEAFDMLVRVLARVCEDPHDPVFSVPVGSEPHRRIAELGDFGFVVFVVDETAGLLRIYDLVWVGLQRVPRHMRGHLAQGWWLACLSQGGQTGPSSFEATAGPDRGPPGDHGGEFAVEPGRQRELHQHRLELSGPLDQVHVLPPAIGSVPALTLSRSSDSEIGSRVCRALVRARS